jgi:hypothetical protein
LKKTLFALLALVLFASPALAVPNDDSTGPEGVNSTGQNNFEMSFLAANTSPYSTATSKETSTERFYLADGWDFGDRVSYRCAWVEYFRGQDEKFEVAFHAVGVYSGYLEILDKYGAELGDGGNPGFDGDIIFNGRRLEDICLDGTGVAHLADFQWDGTDHFPHMVHPGDGLVFYEDGQPMLDAQGDPVFFDLSQPACAKLYWTPGDEPGEAWLWWDEDGPTFSHAPGEGDLGCGGGPLEPVALFQAEVRFADSDIGYCTVSLHEEQCFNVEPPPTPVQLGSGASVLTCPDASTPVVESTEPLVVRCA